MDDLKVTGADAAKEQITSEKLNTGIPKRTVHDWVRDMRMSADVNKTTVGVDTDRVTPDLLLATSQKLYKLSRRETEPDAKDSLQFQRFYGPSELFSEHVLRDSAKLGRNMLWKATNRGNLDWVATNALEQHVSDVFYNSKLAQMVDGSSPLETVDGAAKVSRIGEGGIADLDSAPDEMRTVQPSYFGFIDPVRCFDDQTEIMTRDGWMPIKDVTLDTWLACRVGDKLVYRLPLLMTAYDYDEEMLCYDDGKVSYMVTPNHRMYVSATSVPAWAIIPAHALEGHGYYVKLSHPGIEANENPTAEQLHNAVAAAINTLENPGELIPEWIEKSPLAVRQQFVRSWMEHHADPRQLQLSNDQLAQMELFLFEAGFSYCVEGNSIVITTQTAYKLSETAFSRRKYTGKVYCPTVPGGLVYARRNKRNGFWIGNSPESMRVGLDMYLTKHCMKGSDGKLYQKFINAHTGKEELVDSVTASKSVVASNEMMDADTDSVFALGGKTGVRIVPKKDVDYYLPRPDDAYSAASNIVTGLSGVKEMRLLMGCLHPGTNMLVEDSYRMLSIVPAKSVRAGKVLSGSTDKGEYSNFVVRQTISKFPRKKNDFCKIVLASGRTLITSSDHRWPVLRKGEYTLLPASKLKAGDIALRSSFSKLGCRRTFVNGKLLNGDAALILGFACREMCSKPNGIRIRIDDAHVSQVKAGMERFGTDKYSIYTKAGNTWLLIADEQLCEYLRKSVGIPDSERRVPSEVLSANAKTAMLFLEGYTADETKVGIDKYEDIWLLFLQNTTLRDGLALLLARVGSDTCYRDAVRSTGTELALKISDTPNLYGDMFKDEILFVDRKIDAPYMVDIDIDDNLYAVANGVVTHNSKYPLQAVSLAAREAPLVRNIDTASGKDIHSLIGKYLGARYTDKAGTVTAVRNDRIDMLYDDGTKGSIGLYRNFPMNAKGYITNEAQVKAGQHIDKGGLVASSNYTDKNGVMATGTNLHTAWMSWNGGTYEDAVVLSESAAKKLSSTTMYKTSVDLDRTVSLGKHNYVTWKPGEFTKEQMENMTEDGIVKPGTVLKKGDPMILAVRTSEPSPGTMGKRILTDISERWEHEHPGVVTDVMQTRSGVKVFATVTAPIETGDKVAGLYGNKGVTAQVVPDDQMPQDEQGNPVEMLLSPLGLITRCYDEQTEFLTDTGWKHGNAIDPKDRFWCYDSMEGSYGWGRQTASFHAAYYKGAMYGYRDDATDFLVTPRHRMLARKPSDGSIYMAYRVEELYGKECVLPAGDNKEHVLSPKGWYITEYEGMTYCPTVATGYMLTRRNGKSICMGNTNPAQLHEALLGKVAKKTGKPELIPAFYNGDMHEYVMQRLKQHGLKADEDMTDPNTGRKLKGVTTGYSYIHKLKHLAESKMSARGTSAYTAEETPGGKGYDSSKRYGSMEMSAMIGHAAYDNLVDLKQIRGQSNASFWRSIRTGEIPTMPGEPLVHKKFFAHLTGSGVAVRKTPKGISVFSLTDSDVKELAGPRELKSRDTYEAKNFRPIDGGLFGQDIFGINGDKWGYIQLDEPVPNPVMAEPLARLLNLTDKEFEAVAEGRSAVNGMASSSDIRKALSDINVEAASAAALKAFKEAPTSKKDAALKRYVAIERIRRSGVDPADYMLTRIPVLPPQFRPVSSHNGLTMVADSNYLYAQLLDARDSMREAKNLPPEYLQQARENVHRSFKELVGLHDPESPKLQHKNVRGLLKWALGSTPKASSFMRKVLGASVDTVGRGAIVPDPRVKLNEIGMPEDMAFDSMAPFITRGLVKRGYTPVEAMKQVKERTAQAKEVLVEVMKTHPVQMNRAPTLHKLSIMGFQPVLVPGKAIHVNPSIVVPLAADFDGDEQINCVQIRVFQRDIKDYEKCLDFSDADNLTNCERMLYLFYGKMNHPMPVGGPNMAFKDLLVSVHASDVDENTSAVMTIDLEDIPHGRLIKKNAGSKQHSDFYEALPGMQVLAYDEKTGKLVWTNIEAWSVHRDCAIEVVHLGNGTDIITDDDPRAVYGIAKDAESLVPQRFTPTEALERGVVVPCMKPGLQTMNEQDILRYVRHDGAVSAHKFDEPCFELDFDFGQLLGTLAGDGWWDKVDRDYLLHFGGTRGLYLADNEGYAADYFRDLLPKLLGAVSVYKHEFKKEDDDARFGDTVKYAFHGPEMAQFTMLLSALLGGIGDEKTTGSANKHLPGWTYATSEEFRKGLLCGLIGTDGSISVSKAKAKDQLMVGFCSTSLRLCRELKELCWSLGVRSSISFSKPTARGNSAWQVTLSTFDLKKVNPFVGLCHERKRKIFDATPVSQDVTLVKGDYRPFPKAVQDVVFTWLKAENLQPSMRADKDNPETQERMRITNLYGSARKAVKVGYMTYTTVQQIETYAQERVQRRQDCIDFLEQTVAYLEADVNAELTKEWRDSMWKALHILGDQLPDAVRREAKIQATRRTAIGKGNKVLLAAVKAVLEQEPKAKYGLSEEPLFHEWLELCHKGDCIWTPVSSVEKTGKVEIGYDLSVPGYETFVASNGVVLSNTVNVHVPVSDAAREETRRKMFPERNLIGMRNREILYKPEKEYQQGLFIASRMKQDKNVRPRTFRSLAEAREAYRNDQLDIDDPIVIRP